MERMSVDAVDKGFTVLFLGALAIFLLRLIMLRMQDRYPIFVISNGLDLVFGAAMVALGIGSRGETNVDLVAIAVGVSLTPFVAFELYRTKMPEDHASLRFLAPVVAAMLAGCVVTGFLGSNPDDESMKEAYVMGYFFDTVVTLGVLGFLVGKLRRGVSPADHNLIWMRRLFVFEIASSGIRDMAEPLFNAESSKIAFAVYIGLSFVVTAVCAFALRKQTEVTPA
jgi:asparagine N-glycosylation enzyme membrane subunit Stt3